MEETLQLNTEPLQKSVKVKQNIAAWLLVLTNVYWIFSNVTGVALLEGILQPIIIGLTCIISWGLLCSIASNKATRIVTIIGIVIMFISMITNSFCLYHIDYYTVVELEIEIDSPIFTPDFMLYVAYFQFIFCNFINCFLYIYIYSTLLGANKINNNDKTWLGFLIIRKSFTLCANTFYYIIYALTTHKGFNWGWLLIIFNILTLIAEFRFAKCAAFSGNYNPEPAAKGTFSPFNKYFVATLVAVAFVSGLLYLLYSNVEIMENIL